MMSCRIARLRKLLTHVIIVNGRISRKLVEGIHGPILDTIVELALISEGTNERGQMSKTTCEKRPKAEEMRTKTYFSWKSVVIRLTFLFGKSMRGFPLTFMSFVRRSKTALRMT